MTALAAAGFLAFGFTAGMVFFALLRWNTSLYTRGGSLALGIAVQLLRIAAAGGLLALVALHGPLALLLTMLGLLIARPLVVRVLAAGVT
jgi:F1-F0 ATPase (N-ATPase) AtpR subunit